MKSSPHVTWDKAAEEELGRVPLLLRPLVRKKLEERVLASGAGRVTLAILKEAEARFRSVMAGKSPGEVDKMAPRPNEPGVEMVIVDTCHNELTISIVAPMVLDCIENAVAEERFADYRVRTRQADLLKECSQGS